jgi:hypothetical protein
MSIAISITPAGTIDTYTLLKAQIAEKLDRSDLEDQIPNFIRMAEYRLARVILHPMGETTSIVSTTAGTETVNLPTGFQQLRAAHVVSDPIAYLQQVSPSTLREKWNSGSGSPQAFAIVNGQLLIGPVPDAVYALKLTYLSELTPLSDSSETNWLLQKHADVYVYGSLLQAEAHIVNDARIPLWKSAWDEAIAEINAAGNRYRASASPLRLRNPVVV